MPNIKKPPLALLDGDILAYRTAFWAEANNPDHFPQQLEGLIQEWLPDGIDNDQYILALSCSRPNNFRKQCWPGYKENRKASYVPEYLSDVKEFMSEHYKTKQHKSIEADDLMGIYASSHKMIAVTIDKDLRGTKGWHYNPTKEDEPVYVDKQAAYRFFCLQWMTGDSVDGIPGLWRVGPKKAHAWLEDWDMDTWAENIIEMYTLDKYRPRDTKGLSDLDMALAMARCVKILEKPDYNLTTQKIRLWNPKVGNKDIKPPEVT